MKKVNLQLIYDIAPEYLWLAVNRSGNVVGFRNAPIRDPQYQEWIDPVDGSTGEIIPYEKWEISVREVSELTDMVKNSAGARNISRARANTAAYYPKAKGSKKQ